MTHLETHNLLEQFQSAYRMCHSKRTFLFRVVNDLLQASDDGQVSILLLLDLSAAFNTIDHVIVIHRLILLLVVLELVLVGLSYLSNRTKSVRLGE